MKSHACEFNRQDLVRILGWPLLPVLGFALAMHAGALGSFWPKPRPTLDTERTVLIHQAEASLRSDPVQLLLLGDSSCLMDLNARQLGNDLRKTTLNLGTFSFLDLSAQALFLETFLRHRTTRPEMVVLLMHPEALRRLDSEPYFLGVLTNYWSGQDQPPGGDVAAQVDHWTGASIFRGRFLPRLLPIPLAGSYGRRYGFDRELESFMGRERGSAIDPEPAPFTGVPEYRLAPTLEKSSRAWRRILPAGISLAVGITPVPDVFAGARYPAQRMELLRTWGAWLQADVLLEELPATLPDAAFVRTTHLSESQVPAYTRQLGQSLRKHLR